jgi:23S rRNA (guanosine2251-2'-O)-methyltransferase
MAPAKPRKPPTSAPSSARRPRRRGPSPTAGEPLALYGRHAVLAALGNARRSFVRLLAADTGDEVIVAAATARGLRPEPADARTLDRIAGTDAVHQGVVLLARPLPPADLRTVADHARRILVLDQVEDARNVGAILRSAAAFGVDALVMQSRHAAPLNGACAKAASGALEWVPVALEVNLARTLRTLKEGGFWVAGLDGGGEVALEGFAPAPRQVLVLGAEGRGLRPLVREHCDLRLRIPIAAPVESLNVAVTAGIALCHLAGHQPA